MDDTKESPVMEITIIIKALNEENKIAAAIESSLDAIQDFHGEVILADSASTDKTVEIAKEYPVKIVQLTDPAERCCGIGPQLGYQISEGKFIYILDGDMQFVDGFMKSAIAYMDFHPEVGGVAGIIKELGGGSYEFEARKDKNPQWATAGELPWLEMGGLYRRDALESVGYFSNRNLHAFEEQELGMRLSSSGWKLVRLSETSVLHYGHTDDTMKLLARRWRSKYINGSGELFRTSIGKPYFIRVVKSQINLIAMLGLWVGILLGLFFLPWSKIPLILFVLVFAVLTAVMVIKKKSLKNALTGMIYWQFRTAGFLRGLLAPQLDPGSVINSIVLQDKQKAGYAKKERTSQ